MCFTARLRPFCARCQLLPPALRSLASLRLPLLNGLSEKQKVGSVHTGLLGAVSERRRGCTGLISLDS